jgi:hypothetical protein
MILVIIDIISPAMESQGLSISYHGLICGLDA